MKTILRFLVNTLIDILLLIVLAPFALLIYIIGGSPDSSTQSHAQKRP